MGATQKLFDERGRAGAMRDALPAVFHAQDGGRAAPPPLKRRFFSLPFGAFQRSGRAPVGARKIDDGLDADGNRLLESFFGNFRVISQGGFETVGGGG